MIPSIRNSLSQHEAVFAEAKCNKVFYTPEMQFRIDELKQLMPSLQAHQIQTLDELVAPDSKHYEYNRTWAEAQNDPFLIAHSSGSTGTPKPTTLTNGVYATYDNHRLIPPVPGRRIQSYEML